VALCCLTTQCYCVRERHSGTESLQYTVSLALLPQNRKINQITFYYGKTETFLGLADVLGGSNFETSSEYIGNSNGNNIGVHKA